MSKRLTLAVCTVLPSVWRSTEEFVSDFVQDVYKEGKRFSNVSTFVILAIEMAGRKDWNIFEELMQKYPDLILLQYDNEPEESTQTAGLYLDVFQKALDLKADLILEIDASGAHDSKEIHKFLDTSVQRLKADPNQLISVLSTRFARGGKNSFPENRVALSKLGTRFAHIFLMTGDQGSVLTDFTSGFEAFSGALLGRVFEMLPPKEWISNRWGPMHLFQTEMRAMVCWVGRSSDVEILEMPITFGKEFDRELAPLAFSYLFKAFFGGMLLVFQGVRIRLSQNFK